MDNLIRSWVQSQKLISDEYRRLNADMHSRVPMYGTTGRRYVDTIRQIARRNDARHILDYGCGKRDVWHALHEEFDIREYDPAVPGFETAPEPADVVSCIDVLEHVEPECLDNVLADLSRVTLKCAFLTIATQPSGKTLADGTNCHRIIQGRQWWLERLQKHFNYVRVSTTDFGSGIQIVVYPFEPVQSG